MPLATGLQILTCIGRLDILAHGFEFGGVGGAVGCLCCVVQHHLLLTCPEGPTVLYTDCIHKGLSLFDAISLMRPWQVNNTLAIHHSCSF